MYVCQAVSWLTSLQKLGLFSKVGHKNHFPSMISVPAAFGCQMVQKVSKMSKMTHFTQFSHFFGHYAKHRCYFDFYSSGYYQWHQDTTFDIHIVGFHDKKYFFYKGFPLWIFGAKINVAKTASRYFIEGKRFLCPTLQYRNISGSGFNIAGCILQPAFLEVTKIWLFYGKNRVPT